MASADRANYPHPGMQFLGPGMYLTPDGGLHLFPAEACAYFGIEPTPANLLHCEATVLAAWQKAAAEAGHPPLEVIAHP